MTCGSVNECAHDREQSLVCDEYGSEDDDSIGGENTCEMVTNMVVAPGNEVFNTYGEGLGNAELLLRYGFTLADGNEPESETMRIIVGYVRRLVAKSI